MAARKNRSPARASAPSRSSAPSSRAPPRRQASQSSSRDNSQVGIHLLRTQLLPSEGSPLTAAMASCRALTTRASPSSRSQWRPERRTTSRPRGPGGRPPRGHPPRPGHPLQDGSSRPPGNPRCGIGWLLHWLVFSRQRVVDRISGADPGLSRQGPSSGKSLLEMAMEARKNRAPSRSSGQTRGQTRSSASSRSPTRAPPRRQPRDYSSVRSNASDDHLARVLWALRPTSLIFGSVEMNVTAFLRLECLAVEAESTTFASAGVFGHERQVASRDRARGKEKRTVAGSVIFSQAHHTGTAQGRQPQQPGVLMIILSKTLNP